MREEGQAYVGGVDNSSGSALGTLSSSLDLFGKAERRVATFIVKHPYEAVEMNVSALAKASGCSESTVVRMCQHAGFKGYYQLRLLVARELGDERSGERRSYQGGSNAVEQAISANSANLAALASPDNVKAVSAAVDMLRGARKVLVCASGNTLPVALDMSFRLNRFNIESYSSTVFENVFNYISNSGHDDVLVAISKSGATNLVFEEVSFAKHVGMRVIAITGDFDSRLGKAADLVILSDKADGGLVSVQNGLQSHVTDFCIVDAIMYGLIGVAQPSDFDSSKAAEFELAGLKE